MDIVAELQARSSSPGYLIGVPPGWRKIVIDLHERLLALDPDYTVSQVGSHYGGLWFVAEFTSNAEHCAQLVETAITRSHHRCSVCARPATATLHRADHEPRCRDHAIRPGHVL